MKNTCIHAFCLSLLCGAWACSNDALLYHPDQKRSIYFLKNASDYASKVVPDTIAFSFAPYEENEREYELRIPIKCIGMPLAEDQEYTLEIVRDSTTAEEGIHFEFGTLVIPENEVQGTLSVKLKRTADIVNRPVFLYIRFRENEHFKPMEDDFYCLSLVDGELLEPQWWFSDCLGDYKSDNHKLYRKLLENFWALETLKPLFYADKVKEYGRFLEKAPRGFFQIGNNIIWIKYVFKPAYDFYQDPVNFYEGFAMVNPDQFIN